MRIAPTSFVEPTGNRRLHHRTTNRPCLLFANVLRIDRQR